MPKFHCPHGAERPARQVVKPATIVTVCEAEAALLRADPANWVELVDGRRGIPEKWDVIAEEEARLVAEFGELMRKAQGNSPLNKMVGDSPEVK